MRSYLRDSACRLSFVLCALLVALVSCAFGLSATEQTNTSHAQRVTPGTVPGRNGKLLFTSYVNGNSKISTMEVDGSNLRQLNGNSLWDWSPVWSPDGTRIAFVSTGDDFSGDCIWYGDCRIDIYVMNADGANRMLLTSNPRWGESPIWSPDGTRIAFVKYLDGNVEIYVMNADGTNQTRLTNSPGSDYVQAWSPDSTRLAFTSERDNPNPVTCSISSSCNEDIYVMNADGSNQRRLTNSGSNFGPMWSPDGKRIAFTNLDSNYNYDIYMMNADGSNQTRLTNGPASDSVSAWSPDGKRIAFETDRDNYNGIYHNHFDIYVMNADGTNQTRLTNDPLTDGSAVWSPDGARIAFTRRRPDDERSIQIYVMNADGSNQTRLTNNPGGYDSGLAWQSLPTTTFTNAIDDPKFFTLEHYHDFLNREPDAAGLAFWTNEITQCAGDTQCIEAKRVSVSASFFLSIEFQQTGYLVYRMYKASYGNLPGMPVPITLNEFLPETHVISQGVIVNQTGWEQLLENNKQAFMSEFVQRSRFTSAFPTSMTPTEFVDKLFANAGLTPSGTDYLAALNEFGSVTNSADVAARARALRRVAENSTLAQQEFNRAFVLMQYFGYLRRNPNDPPDADFNGYNFWLTKLNQFNGDYIGAEMVKAFITSTEYRQRFDSCLGCWDY